MRTMLVVVLVVLAVAARAQTNDWEDALVVTQKTAGVQVRSVTFEPAGDNGKTTVSVLWAVIPDTNTVANTNAVLRWGRFKKSEWNNARGTNGPTVKEIERSAVKLAREASK